ncbi:MAG TPA: hypothetical protein VK789_29410 [Bryobacteraceae bacterium]|nr:hypothetical protein [Bryobacteraceae bacterium]
MTILSLLRLPLMGGNPFPNVNGRRFDRYAFRLAASEKPNRLTINK